jgi:two-component system chemotaxis sensor kinase CheA
MTASSMEKTQASSIEALRRSLLQLSQQALASNLSDETRALELARDFEKWTLPASTVFGLWMESFRIESHRIVDALQSGKPSAKAVESLLRSLLQVHRMIEKEDSAVKSPPTVEMIQAPPAQKVPVPLPVAPTPVEPVAGVDPAQTPDDEKEIQAEYLKTLHQGLEFKIGQMDDLFGFLGEVAIAQAEFMEAARPYLAASPTLPMEISRLDKMSKQIRDRILALRSIPVEPLFRKMARQAKGLSGLKGKPLSVLFEGGETELDQGLFEELEGLLELLFKNSLEHGIEPPEERRKTGKPSQGLFQLKASHLAGAFVLEVSDDGRGLRLEEIETRARELGWMKSQDQLTPAQLTDFLFRPGFISPSSQGGAAGFAEMAQRVQKLKGSLRIQCPEEGGLRVLLRLPKTLALIEGILLRVGRKRYLLPMTQVRKISLSDTQVYESGKQGEKFLKTPDGGWPVADLNAWFKEPLTGTNRVALQVEAGSLRLCLLADEVMGKQQVLLKGPDAALDAVPGIRGGAILGDGKVGLILDVEALATASDVFREGI